MAVNLFNYLIFGGINSADYGVYITGEAVYNAPARVVEMVDVPGRNGQIAIDMGHYENLTVTYPCGVFGEDQEDFREAISNFRNAILTKIGYQRLEDSYHPDEYRLGVVIAGMEVDPAAGRAGEFNLSFNCKPQRYLASGEQAIEVESGDTITNPTLCDAQPLLYAQGTGRIYINDSRVTISNQEIGEVMLSGMEEASEATGDTATCTFTFDASVLNTGDDIYTQARVRIELNVIDGTTITATTTSADPSTMTLYDFDTFNQDRSVYWEFTWPVLTFKKGTSSYGDDSGAIRTTTAQGTAVTTSFYATYTYAGNDTITYTLRVVDSSASGHVGVTNRTVTVLPTHGYSTQYVAHTIEIDLEKGEAYTYDGSVVIPLNSLVDMGGDLPVLRPGSNLITMDNTITDLRIEPRWWIL